MGDHDSGWISPFSTISVGYLLPCPSTRSGESQSVEEAVLRLLRINCSLSAVPAGSMDVGGYRLWPVPTVDAVSSDFAVHTQRYILD